MMDDKKIFVFGSFSEDEASSLQRLAASTPKASQKTVASKQAVSPLPRKVGTGNTGVQLSPAADTSKANGAVARNNLKTPAADEMKAESLIPELHTQLQIQEPTPMSANGGAAKGFVPRGLVNSGNTCFLNSTLQALLSCSPFCSLLESLRSRTFSQADFPVLHAFASFAGNLEAPSNKAFEIGKPLTPTMFDPVLKIFTPEQAGGRQEDASEFLGFLMNQMHEELVKLEGLDSKSVLDEDKWVTVGPKNRTTFTRTHTIRESRLREIFGGQQQSLVKAKGTKPSATIQPFYMLELEISAEGVNSVEDALKFYSAAALVDFKTPGGKTEDASKSVKIQSLPKVLILHLLRFSYGAKGTGKLHKPIHVPANLTLTRDLLVSQAPLESRQYELVAAITHHGKDPWSGHYTADARQPDGNWLRFDDREVKVVEWKNVLHDSAYVLFYKRQV